MIKLNFVILSLALLGVSCSPPATSIAPVNQSNEEVRENAPEKAIEFSIFDPVYRFNASIPSGFGVEYIDQIDSINIFNTGDSEKNNLAKSQIFIRYFQANDFLTLATVDILEREKTSINGHEAVRYRIKKKAGAPPFPGQPGWRNDEHDLIDIRFAPEKPTYFYVFARNPEFAQNEFENFIASLRFAGDVD